MMLGEPPMWKKLRNFCCLFRSLNLILKVSEVCYTPLGVIILRDSLLEKYKLRDSRELYCVIHLHKQELSHCS